MLLRSLACLSAVTAGSSICLAQWSVIDLHPSGWDRSESFGVHSAQQVGFTRQLDNVQAAIWTGSAASHVNVHPTGYDRSELMRTDGLQQVGYARLGNRNHAGVWSGSSASFVDLHPAGATSSDAFDVSEGKQVGLFRIETMDGFDHHAALWS